MPADINPTEPTEHTTIESFSLEAFVGPLPPPHILRAYEDAVPGAGQTIVQAFGKQTNHRIETQRREVLFGFIINILLLTVWAVALTLGFVFGYPYHATASALSGFFGSCPIYAE